MTAGAATVDVYGVVDTGLHYVKADSGDTSVTMDSGISKAPAWASSAPRISAADTKSSSIWRRASASTTAPSTTPRTVW